MLIRPPALDKTKDPCYSVVMAETWKTVPGYEGRYEASDQGRIRSLVCGTGLRSKPLILKISLDRYGYRRVGLVKGGKKVTKSVAPLICAAFNGEKPFEDYDCAHLDGDKLNDVPINLSWVSRKENNLHKVDHGTVPVGSDAPAAKLDEPTVTALRNEKASTGISNVKLAKKYGISDRMVGKILNRECWTHI